MSTQQTSIESYHAAIASGFISAKQQAVLKYFLDRQPHNVTQGEVNRHFQDTNRSYAPRFREMEDSGVIQRVGTVLDTLTNRNVLSYQLTGEIPNSPVKRAPTTVNIKIWVVTYLGDRYELFTPEEANRANERFLNGRGTINVEVRKAFVATKEHLPRG